MGVNMIKTKSLREKTSEARKLSNNPNDIRIRAAWLYYIEGMTQSDVAKSLGINRIMVNRLLAEAKKRREVIIKINSELSELVKLQQDLKDCFNLNDAIIAPLESDQNDPTAVIAAAAGNYVSNCIRSDMTIGVGWGKTLNAMLSYLDSRPVSGMRVISLLGGIAQAKHFNPAEFAWQFAQHFEAEGYLIPAPAVVDSAQTKHALLENCGLEQVFQLAESCDAVIFSCGGITELTTSYRSGHISESTRHDLISSGAVGDCLYHFLDRHGQLIEHSVNKRSISMPIERLKLIPEKILISGGEEKIAILHSTLRSLQPTVLITDERSAKALLNKANPVCNQVEK